MSQNDEKPEENNISNLKFGIIIFIFCIFFFLIQRIGKETISKNLNIYAIRSFFIYLIKSFLTKNLLDQKDKTIFSKKNIITILISVFSFSLFILFDESNILI